ncbi:hypothetical protein M4V62_20140 [Streptomyces durmitorensis]|uniref:Lipoprotein n=1 Tax=Streptomyces durmitorensis TaxID=319947 RepID=A0ABY4PVH6_9ACTN|nr:hypothetical protein [Streptomyces durmitorensis]UQT57224.1 hypothetical protein M4V62_20140 [Streptomyces durmitorensis]
MHVRNVRIGAAAAGLVAALVLTGCSSDGGDGEDTGKDKDKGSSAGSDSGSAGSSGGSDAPDEGGEDGSSEGSWVATADGNPLALVIAGKQATLLGENVLCSGTAAGDAIKLKCAKGDSARTEGTVESVNGTSMTVSWQGAGQDQFTRTKGGKLPEGLPTAGIPQS